MVAAADLEGINVYWCGAIRAGGCFEDDRSTLGTLTLLSFFFFEPFGLPGQQGAWTWRQEGALEFAGPSSRFGNAVATHFDGPEASLFRQRSVGGGS